MTQERGETKRDGLQAILSAARKHFLEKGFAGASLSAIAKEAGVTKSLIFHHFESKEKLWKRVKEDVIGVGEGPLWDPHSYNPHDLNSFLESYVTFRFHLYANNPDLVTLMNWQRLDPSISELTGITDPQFAAIENAVRELQANGEIRTDIPMEIAAYTINSFASRAFLDHEKFLETEEGRKTYLKFILRSLFVILNG